MHEVTLPESLFIRLQKLAVPLVDKPADVIERVVSHYETSGPEARLGASSASKAAVAFPEAEIEERSPRERGVVVSIDGHVIRAVSVKEMYQETMKYVLDSGHSKRLHDLMPFSTSSDRYLIADRPIHPNGKEFFVPVKCGKYFMEAHKSYKTGIDHLSRLVEKMGLKLKYLG